MWKVIYTVIDENNIHHDAIIEIEADSYEHAVYLADIKMEENNEDEDPYYFLKCEPID
jgi:hypothetical protein